MTKSTPEFDVIGLGMATVDILTSVPRLPASNEVFEASGIEMQGGGPAATALVALAKLGMKCAYLGTVGAGQWGDVIVQDFVRYCVDTDWIIECEHGTSTISVILVEKENGNRAILYEKGQLPRLEPEQVPVELIKNAKAIHLDGFHLSAAIHAAKIAKEHNVLVSFDGGAGVKSPGIEELLSHVDILVVARDFAKVHTGENDPETAGPELLKFGAREVVITDGENGCWYWDQTQSLHQPAYPVKVKDTTGAGDTFHGAYLYACLQNWEPQQRLKFASALAALKCTKIGGRAGIPTLSETLEFLERNEK